MIRVLVVDDHPVMREGMTVVLQADPDIAVVGHAATGEEAVREAQRTRPSVVMMDSQLPGITGHEACTRMRELGLPLAVVMTATSPHEASVWNAFDAGATGFLLKESEPSVYREAVRVVASGESFIDPRALVKLTALSGNRRALGPFDLTIMEMRVVALLPRGLTNAEIGDRLGISEATVKTHVRGALKKLKARHRTEAVAIAMREGLA